MDWIDITKTQPKYGQKIWAKHPGGNAIDGFASNKYGSIWALEDKSGRFLLYLTYWTTYEVIY